MVSVSSVNRWFDLMMRPTEAMMRRSGDSDALACFCSQLDHL
ncbi:unnamed protein product [Camellia sinensis]